VGSACTIGKDISRVLKKLFTQRKAPAAEASRRHSLSTRIKLAYGAGDLSQAIVAIVLSFFQLFFLVIVAGLSAGSAGLILGISRVWDALSDPAMGAFLDRSRSRFGQRRIWLAIGAVPFGLSFFLLWIVPPFDATGKFIYYLLVILLFETVTTIVGVPYTALTPALTSDYHERTSLNSFRFAFSLGGSLLGLLIHQSIVALFADQQTGYLVAGAVVGAICIVPLLWCFFGIPKEAIARPDQPEASLRRQLRRLLRNQAYLLVMGIYLCSWLAVQITAAVLPFYVTFWLQRHDLQMFIVAAVQAAALLVLFGWKQISERVGKRVTYGLGMALWIGVQAGLFFLQPGQIELAFALAILAGLGVATAYLIPWSMLPDVLELNELRTGERPEGLFYGFMVFAQKLGIGLGLFLVGTTLDAFGFQSPQPGQDPTTLTQPEAALDAIRFIIGPLPALLLLTGMLLAWRYPITRKKHIELQEALAKRNQAEPAAEHR
jgi:GPH family glycoside/pentoside/hexuronide:cation symporter